MSHKHALSEEARQRLSMPQSTTVRPPILGARGVVCMHLYAASRIIFWSFVDLVLGNSGLVFGLGAVVVGNVAGLG